MQDVFKKLNTSHSVLGQDIIDWINSPDDTKTEEEAAITTKLYYKYIVDRNGTPKNKKKIYPDVYYFVNHNNKYNPNAWIAYIVRDQLKSPRNIPEHLADMNIVGNQESFKGSTIYEWAYYQNGSAERPFYMEGCEITTKYLECQYPLKREVYYFVVKTSRNGIQIFRDEDKSPRIRPTETRPEQVAAEAAEDVKADEQTPEVVTEQITVGAE